MWRLKLNDAKLFCHVTNLVLAQVLLPDYKSQICAKKQFGNGHHASGQDDYS